MIHLQKLVCSPEVDKIDMKRTLEQAIKANGLETEIRNTVFHLLRSVAKSDNKNPMQCVRDGFLFKKKQAFQFGFIYFNECFYDRVMH